ncbi:hemerythrin domain-containing protein [Pseudoalteromonas sp. OF7H-1]|uniref:hemerythrin domain-containing protein n=1 Tax=Pseudoalteromonas sp. OF7H-1 TaxID=2917755 RepID=UPI001EF44CDB|nr:hemerythrin domain-containing protein [Pseudoalteromonas sp. OF7H-1]MCG7539243.1 hemerythrin domain-containing protein [Pseudoalteromonas sp. OF7H-1]
MEIFNAIKQDHDHQRALLNMLAETSGDSKVREKYYKELKDALEAHAIAEERYFYAPLMDSDMTIEDSRHGIAEHHEIDELIEALDNTEFSDPSWLTKLKKLKDKVEHHLADEEQAFFQRAGKVLDKSEKSKLADEYQKEMEEQL